jgi:Zn ribbon nucleic-acid-binding protein
MSRFSHHEPCPQCGSKDNLGVWTDGHKFCFGCKYHEQGILDLHKAMNTSREEVTNNVRDFPFDATSNLPTHAYRWLYSCGIYQEQIDKYKIQWSNYYNLVCWNIHGVDGKFLGWQGRCFDPEAKTKYVIQGKIHDGICILPYPSTKQDICVLCEDYMSAIRVSSHLPCVPLFSCSINTEHLRTLSKRFSTLIIWLDSDKLDNARKIASQASMLGLYAKVLYTPEDPKNYTDEQIKAFLEILL